MGLFLNPDIELFSMSVASDIYVDKTGLIDFVNRFIGKERPYLASSRPRRFGKSLLVSTMKVILGRKTGTDDQHPRSLKLISCALKAESRKSVPLGRRRNLWNPDKKK